MEATQTNNDITPQSGFDDESRMRQLEQQNATLQQSMIDMNAQLSAMAARLQHFMGTRQPSMTHLSPSMVKPAPSTTHLRYTYGPSSTPVHYFQRGTRDSETHQYTKVTRPHP
jgi:hypothetical protein